MTPRRNKSNNSSLALRWPQYWKSAGLFHGNFAVSSYRSDSGRVRKVSDELLLEILHAWEQWTGPARGFYTALGVSAKGISSIIGKAKKLKREGFPTGDFKEIKIDAPGVAVNPAWTLHRD